MENRVIPFLINWSEKLKELFLNWGLSETLAKWVHMLIFLAIILVVAWVVDVATKRILVVVIRQLVRKTRTQIDDILLDKGVFKRLAHIVPALVVLYMLPTIFNDFQGWGAFLQDVVRVYMILMGMLVVISFLNSLNEIYNRTSKKSSSIPIKGYVQVFIVILVIIAVVWALSILFHFELKGFFTGLGAFAAVLILVFKDTILGIVASIQITGNKMMRIGDWITMPSRNVDGDVEDITVNTVKVRNFDKTVSTIPTYVFVTESFHNWRGMQESGGRRIKRSIFIDMTSVKFLTDEMEERFKKIHLLKEYIESRAKEVAEYNKKLQVDESMVVNGRRMTNVGTFRKYLEAYLQNHPKIHTDMTFLVRQLQPTSKGIPIEIYVFSNDQAWANYEAIQADIFDHIMAVLPQFDLRVFQEPTGSDIQSIIEHRTSNIEQ